jgi:hypothetical protein
MSRSDRYVIEKNEIDVEMFIEIAKNWTYHIRYGEIDLNKAGTDA